MTYNYRSKYDNRLHLFIRTYNYTYLLEHILVDALYWLIVIIAFAVGLIIGASMGDYQTTKYLPESEWAKVFNRDKNGKETPQV